MKFDSRYSASVRPIFRVPAIIIGAAQFVFGVFYLLDGGFKVGLPQTMMGLMFLTVGIRGHLPKWLDAEEREKEITKGHLGTRKLCLFFLSSLTVAVTILVTMFWISEIFSVGWWFTVVLLVFFIVGFYYSSALLLESKGFNSLLALTIIFPVTLIIVGVVKPKKFDQIYLA